MPNNNLYDKNYAKAVSDIFLEQMAEENVTLDDVAVATNTKYNTLFRYLNGSRQIPIDLFEKICMYLDMDFVKTFELVNKVATKKTINEYNLQQKKKNEKIVDINKRNRKEETK